MVAVTVEALVKRFGETIAVNNVTFTAESEKFVTLLGPSGCGKTTVLRSIAGVEEPDGGTISVGKTVVFSKSAGIMLPPEKRGMGMVYQSYALWPHLSVFENIAYPLKVRKLSRQEIKKRVLEVVELVRLSGLETRLVPNLSGGQQQRVALARAIVYNPEVLLLDEPLSNLDAPLREEMRAELKSLQRKIKVTSIYVTHDRTEALSMSDRIIVMGNGEIQAMGTPQRLLEDPPNSYAGMLLGGMSVVDGKIIDARETSTEVEMAGGRLLCKGNSDLKQGQPVKVLIRGPRVRVHETARTGSNIFPVLVESVTNAGLFIEYKLKLDNHLIKILRDPLEGTLSEGKEVFIEIPSDACVLVRE